MKNLKKLALILCFVATSPVLGMKLTQAAKEGNVEKIKRLTTRRTKNINEKDIYGWTPLMHAVYGNHKDAVETLLLNLADINHKDSAKQWTALKIALSQDNFDLLKMLISYGADINDTDDEGWTPLMLAANNNRAKIVELLLEKGAHKDARNKKGNTALLLAINNGHKETIEILLKHGVGKVQQALVITARKAHQKHLSEEDKKKYTEIFKLIEQFAGTTVLPKYSEKTVDIQKNTENLEDNPIMLSKKDVYIPEKEDFASSEDFKKYKERLKKNQ